MNNRFYFFYILLGAQLTLGGCAMTTPESDELVRIREVKSVNQKTTSMTGLRYTALRDSALSLGARGGLAWQASRINTQTERQTRNLDRIFNFHAMMMAQHVLPPILIEGRQTLAQTSHDNLRIADRAYTIIHQARFVTMPPTWRDYLWLNFGRPELPDQSLMPRDASEKKVWNKYIQEGWQAGIIQANTIFAESLGRLKRDYQGIIRYHALYAQGMVSAPFVAKMELGITGDNQEMAVNDRVLRITALPTFEHDSQHWNTEITPTE
jgi:defect-in-organelle-trafficking protein DotC